jgi:hypothetical protein
MFISTHTHIQNAYTHHARSNSEAGFASWDPQAPQEASTLLRVLIERLEADTGMSCVCMCVMFERVCV